jgi:hypothetical protein
MLLKMMMQPPSRAGAHLVLCCYDKEKEMLKRCYKNIELFAKSRGTSDADVQVRFVDDVDDGGNSPWGRLQGGQLLVSACVRPYSFQHIQQGALRGHKKLNCIVCAWSLSFVMRAQWGGDRWHAAVRGTVESMLGLLDNSTGDAALIIVETLGSGTTVPTRRNVMMELLEPMGFAKTWVRTDYVFESVAEGEALCRFFFARGTAEKFAASGSLSLPECTGIWTLIKPAARTEGTSRTGP